jgi:putative sterol carrier protein
MVRQRIEEAIDRFNRMAQEDPKLQKEVSGIVRRVQIVLEDGPSYHFVLDNGHIDGLRDGPLGEAEITVATDTATLDGIFSGEVNALRAYATKKLKLKASLQDLMTLRKFF